MDATMIGGRRNQAHVARGALDRAAARFSTVAFFASMGLNFLLISGIVYVGSLPREKPVVLVQHDNGTYASYSENVAPNEVGKVQMLSHWFASFRIGSNDARSMTARETAALIPGTGDVKQVVAGYNQSLSDAGARVSPNIRSVRSIAGSPYEYEVDWDETVATATAREVRSMVGYVTVAFDDARANLHDPLLNPFGMYLTKLQISQTGVVK